MTITAIPPLDRTSGTFRAEVDTYFSTRIPTFTTEANALAADLTTKQGLASAAAISANNDKVTTAGYKDTAQFAADAALSYRNQAQAWAVAAADSATTIGTTAAFSDVNPVVKGSGDTSKQLKFEIDGFTTGTTRIVTVPNKSGTMAMLDDGGLVPVAEIMLASAAANIDFLNVFTSAYDRYLITFDELRTSSGASGVCFRAAVAGVADATANSYTQSVWNTAISSPTSTNISVGNADAGVAFGGSGSITLYEVNSTTNTNKRISYEAMYGSTGSTSGVQGYGYYVRGAGAAAMSGFRLYLATGVNFIAGARVRVYGYKKA